MVNAGERTTMASMGTDVMERRHSLGGMLRAWRAAKGMSIEHAAESAGVASMTWRRLEHGDRVWDKTYAAVDHLLHLAPGTALRALGDDTTLSVLAHDLGVDLTTATRPMIVSVAEVLERLSADKHQTAAKRDAVAALLRVLPELVAS